MVLKSEPRIAKASISAPGQILIFEKLFGMFLKSISIWLLWLKNVGERKNQGTFTGLCLI